MYVYVFDRNLTKLADGGEPRLIGKDSGEMGDPDGRYVNQRLLEAAQKGGGTFTFEFLNPATHRIEIKTGYAEMEGDLMVGSGVYMPTVALPGPLAPNLPHVAGVA
jgi:signal transduction histidine kinase